jgi:hypothetical protein
MKRKPLMQVNSQAWVDGGLDERVLGSRWIDAIEAAILLKRFKRRSHSIPSVGAIRNMVYRGQLHARKFFGRVLFDRYEIDRLIAASPFTKGE